MNENVPTELTSELSDFVDDRPQDGVFRVNRQIYNDPDILVAEFQQIFENGWVFLCLEGLMRKTGDYVATAIGRQPVFVVRRADGTLGAQINACAHRGALLTPGRAGNFDGNIKCPYHGWRYDTDGQCIAISAQKIGWPEDDFDRSQFNLKSVPRLESYRGFVFGSLNPDVVPLPEHLGGITKFLDLYCAPAPAELEVVAGACIHTTNCNWKVVHDNGPDPYHAPTVHRNFAATLNHRDEKHGHGGLSQTETGRLRGKVATGSYAMGNGHTAFWADKQSPESFPVYALKDQYEQSMSPSMAKWAFDRSRHVTVFPNLLINELASTYVRTYRPLGIDKTEISSWCVAPVGEAPEARAARLRKFEDFFMPSGMSTPDDIAIFEITQEGNQAKSGHWSDMTRGASVATPGPDDRARELGIDPDFSSNNFQHEIMLQGIYRQWSRMMFGDGTTP